MIWLAPATEALSLARQHRAVWQLLHHALAEQGITLRPERIEYSPTGKPSLADPSVHFSLSHDPTMVAAITGTCPVGIDVEAIRPFRQVALAMAFSPQEQARIQDSPQPELSFFARWCLKESELKRKGGVLDKSIRRLSYPEAFSWERQALTPIERVSAEQWLIITKRHVIAVSGIHYDNAQQRKIRFHRL